MAKDATDDLDHPAIREAFSDDVNLTRAELKTWPKAGLRTTWNTRGGVIR